MPSPRLPPVADPVAGVGSIPNGFIRPSESPHDSPWILGDEAKTVFLGDQIYDHKHCYLADGFYAAWLANIETLRTRFPEDAVFYIGHGGPVGREMWDW